MSKNMRFKAGLSLLLFFALGMVSCDDALTDGGRAEVGITLKTDNALDGTEETAVRLNCTATDGKPVVVVAEEVADGHYAAHLPENSTSGSPFIEVVMEDATYGYSPDETCFQSGQRYEYSLVLGPDGLFPVGTGMEIEDWEIVEGGNAEATMQ